MKYFNPLKRKPILRTIAVLILAAIWAGYASYMPHVSHAAQSDASGKVRIPIAQTLPQLNGERLKTTLVEVTYAPGAASAPHSHPCPVIGYVISGELRTQVKGGQVVTYRAGETFYEPPNGVHLVSANASKTEPAKLLAIFVCDHEAELSTPVIVEGEKGKQ
jgi:quercetin dioxygenase-like cupin family protein